MQSGGSERQMLQLLIGLNRQKVRPHLYLTYRNGPLLESIPSDVKIEAFAAEQNSMYCLLPGSLYGLQVRMLRNVLRRNQIAVSYDRLYHTVMLGALACTGLSVARVVTVVSPPSRDFGQSKQRWKSIKRAVLGWSYRSAKTLLAVSEESAADAAEFYKLKRHRFQIVPSPIDFAAIDLAKNSAPPVNFQKHPGLNIAMVGRLSAEKNHRLLVEVLRRLHGQNVQAHLHVVGDGVLRQELQSLAEQANVAQRVTWYGVQSNPHRIVARCDVFCLPSLYEGFPNVVMEAMAVGTPVIASNQAGGLQALLGKKDERGQQLSPNDADQWTAALANLASKKPNLANQIEMAKTWVLQHHDLPAWISEMEYIFRQAIE